MRWFCFAYEHDGQTYTVAVSGLSVIDAHAKFRRRSWLGQERLNSFEWTARYIP